MMSHDEASELLAVAALDAADADTLAAIDEHAATCPRCQSELDSYRAVASAMGNAVEELPEGLWTNIASQLWARTGESTAMPPLLIGDAPGRVVAIGAATRRRRMRTAFGAVAFAAAASIVVLALSLSSAQNHVTNLQGALQSQSRSAAQRALATPGHQVVNLTSATDQRLAEFVILPDGTGYLVRASMPALAANETYQLWGIVNGSPVSIGVMGAKPRAVTFTLASSPGPSALAVTVQQAGGSLTPSKTLVASGPVVAT